MTSPFDKPTIESRLSVRGVKWHRDSPDIIPLWLADQDYPICPELKQVLRDAVEEEFTVYSQDLPAREAMKEKIKRYNNIDVPVDQIMLTQGVIPGMWLASKHACRPGDEMIVTDPMYFPFFTAAEVTQVRRYTGNSSWMKDINSTPIGSTS